MTVREHSHPDAASVLTNQWWVRRLNLAQRQ